MDAPGLKGGGWPGPGAFRSLIGRLFCLGGSSSTVTGPMAADTAHDAGARVNEPRTGFDGHIRAKGPLRFMPACQWALCRELGPSASRAPCQ